MNKWYGRAILLSLIAIAAPGCEQSENPSTNGPGSGPVANRKQVAPMGLPAYDVDVIFDGLIAYVQKNADPNGRADEVWALLINADWDDSKTSFAQYASQTDQFPPCAYDEIANSSSLDKLKDLKDWYPPHSTRLRFRNAIVKPEAGYTFTNEVNGQEIGESIAGKDLEIRTSPNSGELRLINFDLLGSTENVRTARDDKKFPSYDEIDRKSVIDANWGTNPPNFVSARVLVAKKHLRRGVMVANVLGCSTAKSKWPRYGYTLKASNPICSGADASRSIYLAEDVVLEERDLTESFEVLVNGRVLNIEPKVAGEKVTVEIMNVVNDTFSTGTADSLYLAAPEDRACGTGGHGSHHAAYRWFERLSTNKDALNCKKSHPLPCAAPAESGSAGGRKCPQRLLKAEFN